MGTPGSLWIGEKVVVGLSPPRSPPPAHTAWDQRGNPQNLRFLLFPNLLSSRTSRFVVYKLPAHSGSKDTPKGLTYKYMDQNSEGWQDGVGYINSSEGAVGRSLQPLYRKNSSQVT